MDAIWLTWEARRRSSWMKSASSSCSSRAENAADSVQWGKWSKDWSWLFTRTAVSARAALNGPTCQMMMMMMMTKTMVISRLMGKSQQINGAQKYHQEVALVEGMSWMILIWGLSLHWSKNLIHSGRSISSWSYKSNHLIQVGEWLDKLTIAGGTHHTELLTLILS